MFYEDARFANRLMGYSNLLALDNEQRLTIRQQ
jgi:hypothetical protein